MIERTAGVHDDEILVAVVFFADEWLIFRGDVKPSTYFRVCLWMVRVTGERFAPSEAPHFLSLLRSLVRYGGCSIGVFQERWRCSAGLCLVPLLSGTLQLVKENCVNTVGCIVSESESPSQIVE